MKVTLKVSQNLYASTLPLLVAAKYGERTLADGLTPPAAVPQGCWRERGRRRLRAGVPAVRTPIRPRHGQPFSCFAVSQRGLNTVLSRPAFRSLASMGLCRRRWRPTAPRREGPGQDGNAVVDGRDERSIGTPKQGARWGPWSRRRKAPRFRDVYQTMCRCQGRPSGAGREGVGATLRGALRVRGVDIMDPTPSARSGTSSGGQRGRITRAGGRH